MPLMTESHRTMRRRRSAAQPEILEQRVLLSNVTVTLKNGDLLVKGDSGNNSIQIVDASMHAGQLGIRIQGVGGTTVNGESSYWSTLYGSFPDDVKLIFSQGGTNTVLMVADVDDDLFFKGGRGRDTFIYSGEVGDNLKVTTSNGIDGVALIDTEIGNEARFTTGGGDDKVVVIDSLIEQDIEANTGGGDDSVLLQGTSIREDVNMKTGSGNDFVAAEDTIVDVEFNLNLGSGNDDFFYVSGNDAGEIRLNGGSGFDRHNLGSDITDYVDGSVKGFEDQDASDFLLQQRYDELFG